MDVIPSGSLSNSVMANSSGNDVSGLGNSMNKANDKGSDWNQTQMYPSGFFGAHTSSHNYQHTPTTNSSNASFKSFVSRQNDWAMHASSVYSSMASGSLAGMQMLHPETAAVIQSSFDPGALGLVACRKIEGQPESDTSRPQSVSRVSTASDANAWNMQADETEDSDQIGDNSLIPGGDNAVGSVSKQQVRRGNYTCKSCGEVFEKRDDMRAHRRLLHSIGNHQCTECDKVFSHRSHLQQHVRIHTGEKLYKCQICFKEFIHSGSLSNHMKCHANENNAQHMERMRSASTSASVRTDSESDTKESGTEDGKGSEPRRQPFNCHCGKKFACFAKLQLHERTHTGEKPYACDVCDRAFAEKGNLEKHKRIHTRETPYLCRECGELFSHSYQLKRHRIRVHAGEKPFICTICDKAFSEKGNLIQHERTHSTLKPFSCEHCHKSFSHSTGLNTHYRKRHNLQPAGSIFRAKSQSIGVGPNRKMYVDSAVQTYTVVGPSVETYGPCGEAVVERPQTFPYERPHILQRQESSSIDPRYSLVHQEAMTSVGFDSRPTSANSECQTTVVHDKRSGGDASLLSHKINAMTSSSLESRGHDSQHGHDSRSMSMRPMDMRALDVRSSSALMHTAVSAGRDAISRSSFLSDMVPSSGVELRNVLAAAQESLNNRSGSHGIRLPGLMPDMMSMGAMDARLAHVPGMSSVSDLRCTLGQELASPGVDPVSFNS